MIKLLISLAILLILFVCMFSIMISFYQTKRPDYTKRMKKISITLFIIALVFVGLGISMKVNFINI